MIHHFIYINFPFFYLSGSALSLPGFNHPSVPPSMTSPRRQRSRSPSPVRIIGESGIHHTQPSQLCHPIFPPHLPHPASLMGGHSRLIPSPTPSQKSDDQKIDVTGKFCHHEKLYFLRIVIYRDLLDIIFR